MAEKMIEEIRLAEQKADEIAAEAYKRADQIILNANAQAKEAKTAAEAEIRKETARILSTAENDAYKILSKAQSKNDGMAEQLVASVSENIEEAVKLVLTEVFE